VGFLSPWFLAGALAVGLPIWLHLLQQHRSTPLKFSSLMFFEQRTQSSIKHRRLKYLLLFALRVALLILLALAFANPFLTTEGGVVGGRDRMLVLAIDNSFSMRQGDRLAQAKQAAVTAASGVRPNDRAQVLAFNSGVAMMSDVTADVPTLRAAVQAIQPTDGRGSYAELSRALRSIAQSARMPVETHLFSDLQKSSWPSNFGDARLADGIKLVFHPVVQKREPNLVVETVTAPRHVYDPKKVRIQATISNYGGERATKRVLLLLNGKELQSKSVDVPAGGRASAEFLGLEAPYGLNRGEIKIDPPDAFPDDDHYLFSAERADPHRVLFVHESRDQRSLLYFRTALEASNEGAFALDDVVVEQSTNINPTKYALVVLSDCGSIPAGFEEALRTYVRGGGSVWISLGRFATVRTRVPVFEEEITEARYASREGQRFTTIASFDPAHPSLRGAPSWDSIRFYRAVHVEPGKAKILAKLTDDTPLLMEKQLGEGRILLFASTFDNISNDFPVHASWVPFVAETARYLGHLDDENASSVVGSFLELRTSAGRGTAVEVLDPSGKRALTLDEAAKAQTLALSSAGYWDVRRPNGRHDLVAVNPDRRESDLDILSPETLSLWQNTGQGVVSSTAGSEPQKRQNSFWWYVMAAALVLGVAETWIGNQHLAVEREA
jgi:Aerotolerance regulator N-terminal/von Willebrand factor type A domain